LLNATFFKDRYFHTLGRCQTLAETSIRINGEIGHVLEPGCKQSFCEQGLLDENGSPVVVEYKRTLNENVITQGLFYIDWLLDYKAEFILLVSKTPSSPW
jgi:hypothetical protein